jgi:hypothetical protein
VHSLQCVVPIWDGENMLNLLLHSHPVFISLTSRVIIWGFRLRIGGIATLYQL